MTISIIIPNYNGFELLRKNIPYVLAAAQNNDNQISEVIVVDDRSVDMSTKFLSQYYPQIKLIKHKKNRGFSSTINTGVRGSKGDFLVLLNSDVQPAPDFLATAIPHFTDPKVFAVSFHEEGYSWARGYYKNGFVGHGPGELTNDTHESFWVNGGSGMFRREHWLKLGGFDEKLFSPFYWEDIDLCYRAQKRGYICLWEPKAKVIHAHEQTISKLSKRHVMHIRERNQLIFIWKNITSPPMLRHHYPALLERLFRHPGYFLILLAVLKKLPEISKARKKEKKESKVSDEAIFAKYRQI